MISLRQPGQGFQTSNRCCLVINADGDVKPNTYIRHRGLICKTNNTNYWGIVVLIYAIHADWILWQKSNIQHIRTALIMWTWGCDLFSIRRQYAFGKKLDSSSKEKWWTRDFASMLVFKGKCQIVCVMAIHLVVKAKFLFSHRLCMKDDEILNFLVTIFKDWEQRKKYSL